MKNIVLPDNQGRSLAFYLAMEEFVARTIEDEAFFVWRVAPTVIIGRNQDLEAEVNLEYCRTNGVEVVRRKSGGGCVYSDRGNIMISYVSERGQVSEVFERYLSALTECLRSLGLDAEKSGRNEVLVKGRKVSGNAFHQLPDRSIVHGTLLYDTDFDALENMDLTGVKIMWTNYPNMPTGAAASEELYARLVDFGRRHGILICNDNPYSFTLNDKPLSILSQPGAKDCCLELNSLSKAHNMAGWRIGMLAALVLPYSCIFCRNFERSALILRAILSKILELA